MVEIGVNANKTGDQLLTLEISNQRFVKTENSDGVSKLGLGLENRLETHFCESQSRIRSCLGLGLEGYRSWSQAYCLETLSAATI